MGTSQTAQVYIVRISVPSIAGAMVIGKGGSIAKSIREKSGANVNVHMDNTKDVYITGQYIVVVTMNRWI